MIDLAKATAAVRNEAGSRLCSWTATNRICSREAGALFCICENIAKAVLDSQITAPLRLGRWNLSQPGLAIDGTTVLRLPNHCYRLATLFATSPDRSLTYKDISKHVTGLDYVSTVNVRTAIKRIRSRLGRDLPIHSLHGIGYIHRSE